MRGCLIAVAGSAGDEHEPPRGRVLAAPLVDRRARLSSAPNHAHRHRFVCGLGCGGSDAAKEFAAWSGTRSRPKGGRHARHRRPRSKGTVRTLHRKCTEMSPVLARGHPADFAQQEVGFCVQIHPSLRDLAAEALLKPAGPEFHQIALHRKPGHLGRSASDRDDWMAHTRAAMALQ